VAVSFIDGENRRPVAMVALFYFYIPFSKIGTSIS
jgi:hypothetical protein